MTRQNAPAAPTRMPMGRNRPVPNHRSTSQPMPPQATTPDNKSPMMVQATSDPPGPSRPLLPGADPMGWANIPEGTGVGWLNARAGDNEGDQPVRGDPGVRSPSGVRGVQERGPDRRTAEPSKAER